MSVSLSGRFPAALGPGRVSPGIIRRHRERHMRGVARTAPAIDRM
jgi:hypothetical protein